MTDDYQNVVLPLILVVDDDSVMRLFHEKLLKDLGRIITAENTYDAEKMMRLHRPALVLLDDIMPNCPTGLSFLEKIKKDKEFSDIPIIMVTASNKKEEIMRGLHAGAAAYITKPVNAEMLYDAVRTELKKKPKCIWIMMQDTTFGAELEDMFCHLKCTVVVGESEKDFEIEQLTYSPDLILIARISAHIDARQQFNKIRSWVLCKDVPILLIGETPAEGVGLTDPSAFLLRADNAQEVALKAARLMRSL